MPRAPLFCSHCGGGLVEGASFCGQCGSVISASGKAIPRDLLQEPLAEPAPYSERPGFGTPQVVALCGCALLTIGVFAPFFSAPFLGNQTYFMNGKGDGTVILFLTAVSLLLIFGGGIRFLWGTGITKLIVLSYTVIAFSQRLDSARAELEQELAGNPLQGLAGAGFDSVQLQWGVGVLLVGIVLIFVAATLARNSRTA